VVHRYKMCAGDWAARSTGRPMWSSALPSQARLLLPPLPAGLAGWLALRPWSGGACGQGRGIALTKSGRPSQAGGQSVQATVRHVAGPQTAEYYSLTLVSMLTVKTHRLDVQIRTGDAIGFKTGLRWRLSRFSAAARPRFSVMSFWIHMLAEMIERRHCFEIKKCWNHGVERASLSNNCFLVGHD
jgi:hypothetical protein